MKGPKLQLMAAVDRRWGIGRDNDLLFRISEDLRRFRALTMGNVLIMGRKTFQSLPGGPGGKPLPGRDTIILTRNPSFAAKGAVCCSSLVELNAALQSPAYEGKAIFVAGGAELYALLAPYAETALITHVFALGGATCFFPRISRSLGWSLIEKSPIHEDTGLRFLYATYQNKNVNPLP